MCVRACVRACVGVFVTVRAVNFKIMIMNKLLEDYNPDIRPVVNHTTPTIVTIMLTLKQLRRLVSSNVAKVLDVAYRVRCYGNMHVFTSPPDTVWCLTAIQHAPFVTDTGDSEANENTVSH